MNALVFGHVSSPTIEDDAHGDNVIIVQSRCRDEAAGIRDPDGIWEISLFAKNLFETEKALSRTNPLIANYRQLGFDGQFSNGRPVFTGPTSSSLTGTYTGVTLTPPREFGINVRYSFGAR